MRLVRPANDRDMFNIYLSDDSKYKISHFVFEDRHCIKIEGVDAAIIELPHYELRHIIREFVDLDEYRGVKVLSKNLVEPEYKFIFMKPTQFLHEDDEISEMFLNL